MELAGNGVALHREGAVSGNVVLPGDGLHTLEKLLKASGREFPQHQQHPGAAAEVYVEPCAVVRGAVAKNAPVLYPDIF